MKYFFTILLLLIVYAVQAQFNGPESIDYHAPSNRYFISNTGGGGSIKIRNSDGSITNFVSGINPAPYGIEIVGDTLYACCSGILRGYDINTSQLVISINTGATFLNGITHDNNGNLFATDFTGKKIYRIKPLQGTSNIMVSGLTASPNGIIYDEANNRCVFVNWGSSANIMELNLNDSSVSVLQATSYSNIDGIAKDDNNNYYIATWGNNSIIRYANNFGVAPEIVATGTNKPADIYYNVLTDTLAVPNSGNNTITFLNFAPPPPPPLITICNQLPVTINPDSIYFKTIGASSFGDSAIYVVLFNNSDYNFAYPLAWYEFLTPLPAGVTVHPNSQTFNVFASAWNLQTYATSLCTMFVTQPIPDNYEVKFRLWLTNLEPAPADTCYFTDTFSVVLKKPTVSSIDQTTIHSLQLLKQENNVVQILTPLDYKYICVTDISGRVIATIPVQANVTSIDMSHYTSGMYFMEGIDNYIQRSKPLKVMR